MKKNKVDDNKIKIKLSFTKIDEKSLKILLITKNIGTEKHSRNNETTNASKYIKRPLFLSGLDHKLLERLAPEQTMLKL